MIAELADVGPLGRVLLQAAEDKTLGLVRHSTVAGEHHRVLDDLDQLLLLGDVEWVVAHQHLVHHDPQRPDVYLLVVADAFEDLGGHVQGRAAESATQALAVEDRPAEIAHLHQILHKTTRTSCMTIFSGLISRWMIWLECS